MIEWIKNNLVLSICIVAIIVSLIAIVIILICKKFRKPKNKSGVYDELIDAFGGIDNIIEIKARESRLSLILKDYSLINEDKLKEKGITSSIKMTNKITYVVGSSAKEIEDYVNKKSK